MARQVRIEFLGAIYHVMARGDRRELIVWDDEDRRSFVRTLGEGCERAGFRVHAWVVMSNHYHLFAGDAVLAQWRAALRHNPCNLGAQAVA
jgi:putative transposase